MTAGPFDIAFEALPGMIPVFPLSRVLLLPRGSLPLNIFEPRYLAMIDFALSHDRLIGMVQPRRAEGEGGPEPVEIFDTGCAGRIVSFNETPDGRMLITLEGVCRFNVARELDLHAGGFRCVAPDWSPFEADTREDTKCGLDCEELKPLLRAYLEKHKLVCDKWDEMGRLPMERLVTSLSMVCPFDADEKQMLLEAPTLDERARVLRALLETAVNGAGFRGCGNHH